MWRWKGEMSYQDRRLQPNYKKLVRDECGLKFQEHPEVFDMGASNIPNDHAIVREDSSLVGSLS